MHGSKDPGVPLTQSQNLHTRLRAAGVESVLEIIEGAGHGGELFHSEDSREIVRAFLTKHLKQNWPYGNGE